MIAWWIIIIISSSSNSDLVLHLLVMKLLPSWMFLYMWKQTEMGVLGMSVLPPSQWRFPFLFCVFNFWITLIHLVGLEWLWASWNLPAYLEHIRALLTLWRWNVSNIRTECVPHTEHSVSVVQNQSLKVAYDKIYCLFRGPYTKHKSQHEHHVEFWKIVCSRSCVTR